MGVYNKGEVITKMGIDMEMTEKSCMCQRTKKRSDEEYKALVNRLNRIEGQVRGVKGMVERDAYCIEAICKSILKLEQMKEPRYNHSEVFLLNKWFFNQA